MMCEFKDFSTACHQPITEQLSADVHAVVNTCNTPVDVTFQIQTTNKSSTWAYTFVNSNEVQSISGLAQDVQLEVQLIPQFTNSSRSLHIQADFLLDNVAGPMFINSTVPLPKRTHCHSTEYISSTVPLIIFIALVLLMVFSVVGFLWWRKSKRKPPKFVADELLRNIEGPSISGPFQEGISYFDNPTRSSSSSTLIHNSVYRDTVCPETPPQLRANRMKQGKSHTANGGPRGGARAKKYRQKVVTTLPPMEEESIPALAKY